MLVLTATVLTGCAAPSAHPLHLSGGGISTCIPDPNGDPAIIGVNFHNTLSSPVTVIGGTVAGKNVIPGTVWVLDPVDHINSVESGATPFSQVRKWGTRQRVGKIIVGPDKWVRIAVSFSFRNHTAIGAAVNGLHATYQTTDGSTHIATSSTKASYKRTCGF